MVEAKDGETERNLAAKRRFATLLNDHLVKGTHEKGSGPPPWTDVRFALALGVSDRTVANWSNVDKPRLPATEQIGSILRTLFGNGTLHADAKSEMEQAYTEAYNEALGDVRSRNAPKRASAKNSGLSQDWAGNDGPAGNAGASQDSRRGRSSPSPAALAEVARAEAAIAARLSTANPALDALANLLKIPSEAPSRPMAVARALVAAGPREALRMLRRAHHAVSGQGAGEAALDALKQVSQDIVMLVYEPDQIAAVRGLLDGNGGGMITVPAHNLTFAEIVMAKLDGRRLRLKGVDPKDWRMGVNLIPMPPESGPEGFAGFRRDFERLVFERTLNDEELAWTDDDRRRSRSNMIIGDRFPEIDGSLYFAVKYKVHQAESAAFEAFVAGFMQDWPTIKCFKLDRDPALDDQEVAMLRSVLDMLPEDQGPP